MHRHLMLLPLLLASGCVLAQSARDGSQGGDRQAAREQLRGELRGAAQAARPGAEPLPQPAVETEHEISPAGGRRLTPRERAEMRQQLRQEQQDYRRIRP